MRPSSVVDAASLQGAEAETDAATQKYGSKMGGLIRLIKGVGKKERVLVFVQFPDLMKEVSERGEGRGALKTTAGTLGCHRCKWLE